MCTTVTDLQCNIAYGPITCYKVVRLLDDGSFISPIFDFIYKLEDAYALNEGDMKKFPVRKPVLAHSMELTTGFHSYKYMKDAVEYMNSYVSNEWVLLKCEIPPGARYWVGDFGMVYCSDSISPVAWRRRIGKTLSEWSKIPAV